MLFGLTSELLHEFGLKGESCGLDKPLAFQIPGKMGCSHLPNGTRWLLNSSIISKQQLEGIIIQGKAPASYEAQCSATKSSGKPERKLSHSISITARLIPTSCHQQEILTQTQSSASLTMLLCNCHRPEAKGSCSGTVVAPARLDRPWSTILLNSTLTTSNLTVSSLLPWQEEILLFQESGAGRKHTGGVSWRLLQKADRGRC